MPPPPTKVAIEDYFQVNVTIPLLDERMNERFSDGQEVVIKGFMLIPAHVVIDSEWKSSVAPFVAFHSDCLPSLLQNLIYGIKNGLGFGYSVERAAFKSYW